MNSIISVLQDIFMLKKDDGIKVGLTQFKKQMIPVKKTVSIRSTKEVKLSDLMRRA